MAPCPSVPTLIYDASCGFCRMWVARAQRLDRQRAVRCLPVQDDEALRVSGQERECLEQAAHLVRPDGAVFAGAAAVRELLRYLPGGLLAWAVLGTPGVLPLAERIYAWVARTWGPLR